MKRNSPRARSALQRKALAGRAIECGLVLLIVCTVILHLASGLPASSAAITRLVAQARSSADAARLVADALAADPSPSRRTLLELQRSVVAVERAGLEPAQAVRADAALVLESKRLAATPFSDMTADDQLHWVVLNVGRAVPAVIALATAWCGWRLWQRRMLRRQAAN
ncbi:hypothetical protein AB4Y43_16835 [Paraburkholderia sp. BR10872]|uniref:hypothetical protein n=1 Tax=Paraburkholderia sp. BR10872 TaxID=3236989 RepID=UPI0034D2595F